MIQSVKCFIQSSFMLKIFLLALGFSVLATKLSVTAFPRGDAKSSTMNKICQFLDWPIPQSIFLIDWLEDGSDDPSYIGGVENEIFFWDMSIWLQWFAAFLIVFGSGGCVWRGRHKLTRLRPPIEAKR